MGVDEGRGDAGTALRRSEASFRALTEASPELILVHRSDSTAPSGGPPGRIVYVNAAVLRTLGYDSRRELIDRSYLDLMHPDDRSLAAEQLVEPAVALRTGGGSAAVEPLPIRWRRRDGATRMTETTAISVEFDGAPAVALVARDVTERNEIQAQLLRNDRMAALGTLAAGVAHEINNPLTYLYVNLEHTLRKLRALSASDDPAEELAGQKGRELLTSYAQSLSHAMEGANRVRQIVRDLMTFSQGNVEQRGLVDLRGVVESAIQMAWHEIRHRARLVKNLYEVPPVEANEARLGQVFLNLLVNAAQAIPEGNANVNEVRVSTRTDDKGNVIVEVADTGAGIPPEALSRVFDPFFTTRTTGTGSGLGLSVSHGTVRSMGGDLLVESTLGKGSTFRVVLPAAKAYRNGGPTSVSQLRPTPRRKVLIIDDEPLVSEALTRVLSDENDVKVAFTAREGLELIARGEHFDTILCDLMMPVMTGMDLYAEVVRIAPHVAGRIVFMTGGAFTPRARAFLESVGNPCLEKPVEVARLRSLIAKSSS